MDISFLKMHGLGNDFVILDGRENGLSLSGADIRKIANRKRGVGCDQLIILENPAEGADVFMRIFNPDGSQSGACGNATRCVADMVMAEREVDSCVVQTIVGKLKCTRAAQEGYIRVDMGAPGLEWQEIPLSNQCDTLALPLEGAPVGVSMGNPHCVFFCENAEDVDVENLGVKTEHDPLFPERTNVEYVSMLGENHLRMRVWERGAGITQACGTGACAAAVAAARRGLSGRQVTVTLDGGDLVIDWREDNGHVYMTGPVAYVFEGSLILE